MSLNSHHISLRGHFNACWSYVCLCKERKSGDPCFDGPVVPVGGQQVKQVVTRMIKNPFECFFRLSRSSRSWRYLPGRAEHSQWFSVLMTLWRAFPSATIACWDTMHQYSLDRGAIDGHQQLFFHHGFPAHSQEVQSLLCLLNNQWWADWFFSDNRSFKWTLQTFHVFILFVKYGNSSPLWHYSTFTFDS